MKLKGPTFPYCKNICRFKIAFRKAQSPDETGIYIYLSCFIAVWPLELLRGKKMSKFQKSAGNRVRGSTVTGFFLSLLLKGGEPCSIGVEVAGEPRKSGGKRKCRFIAI